ncbi:putative sec34-like family protein [Rosellinia necatrix]|uniref:Conserved oligomeric Golgi complex subunit 3 n=1 Tax=Rosellinia necatrix TaxID=77044 RepID=A0A1W2TQI8_ROSNE|nr:putative sec34-like family protein [Rosellinia necatrix]
MYEDSWYSLGLVPDHAQKKNTATPQPSGHRRRESLLQPPNGNKQPIDNEPLERLFEEPEPSIGPPEPTLLCRAKSCSDFEAARGPISKDGRRERRKNRARRLDALMIAQHEPSFQAAVFPSSQSIDAALVAASQQEYMLYRDQLSITGRHLDRLVAEANGALDLLTSLADNFRAVEAQTSSFQAQCDHLLSEERRLQKLADEVGTDLHYYAYLDGVTRRLNALGANRLVNHENFGEILTNLDACIGFMVKHPDYRDAESYLARYQSLLTKALHLLEVGFSGHLEQTSLEISKQILATQSEASRHALAYGRSEQTLLEADGLITNVQRVIRSCYDQFGQPISGENFDTYLNTAVNLFSTYLDMRDRSLRPITQHDIEVFRKDAKDSNVETACRNFIKQSYERSFNEAGLFSKVFSIEPQFSPDGQSAYATLKAQQKALVNTANLAPIATTLQPALQSSDLQTTCSLLGWVTNEYLLLEYDEEETQYSIHCHDLTARLLTEHLWPFADSLFEAEVTKTISKPPIAAEALKATPATSTASSNTYPIVKHALELLAMHDQAMPKERSQKSSPVVFRIVTETISALQRVETRLKTNKAANPDPDPDLFMIKNLLILKNGLMSLEIGDVRAQPATMQYFGQIWDTLSPQNWMGLFRGILGGTLTLGLWSSMSNTGASTNEKSGTSRGQTQAGQDANEKLDELLRQSIYAFTQRWGTLINGAKTGKRGQQTAASTEKELDHKLSVAFGGQPEVMAKLKEAIYMNAQAQKEVKAERGSR